MHAAINTIGNQRIYVRLRSALVLRIRLAGPIIPDGGSTYVLLGVLFTMEDAHS